MPTLSTKQYSRDTVTLTYVGTANFSLILYAYEVAYSSFAALDSVIDSSDVPYGMMQVPLYGSGIVHTYNLPNITLTAPLVPLHLPPISAEGR
jgi:hypothetical protein